MRPYVSGLVPAHRENLWELPVISWASREALSDSSFVMWRLAIIELAVDSHRGLTDDEEKQGEWEKVRDALIEREGGEEPALDEWYNLALLLLDGRRISLQHERNQN